MGPDSSPAPCSLLRGTRNAQVGQFFMIASGSVLHDRRQHEPWPFPAPKDAVAATDLAALRGDRITEAMRWEEDEWEIFAGDGPDIPEDELRVVSLGSLVAMDESLVPVVYLAVGEGLLRDPDPD